MFKAILLTLALSTAAFAEPACDVSKQESTLVTAATAQGLVVKPLTGGTLKAFNAVFAQMTQQDPADIPDMDQLDTVDVDGTTILFAFKDGCLLGAVKLPTSLYNVMLERTQAGN